MAPPAKKQDTTSRARLSAVIKSARDIMRKDAGLNGDLDRLPLLSWLLFLRSFDALEAEREVFGEDPIIKPEYQWRAWADDETFTGAELLAFVNGKLLPELASMRSDVPGDPRNVLGQVFAGVQNRMLSGYLFRDLVNQIRSIDFNSSDDIHTMAFLYEDLLKQMRDAAGDSGEFYTPRPVIRFMVEQTFLKLGESIMDPACGTGGFLVEAYTELFPQATSKVLQQQLFNNIRGIEKKPLPFLLCMMNLTLHGIPSPKVLHANSLRVMIDEKGPGSQVDVILTNPPFGGEEEDSIAKSFPSGYQTRETAWLFLHAVIKKLKQGGRCAIVLPNGALFGEGIGAKIRKQLLEDCDLHTVVRLPQGVFAPYTQIPANLLFFDKTVPTKETWFYEITPPEGSRGYAKTRPMRYEEFESCAAWWGGPDRADRIENDRAWRVPIADLLASGFNLDLTNPNTTDDLSHRSPTDLLAELIETEQEVLSLLTSLQKDVEDR
ncbi:HsdM family class I SAM-dependent methyltransferase [Nonomuraea jabiensis]|uniref:site-specific DNA-methyltransferase (adenine-specific) n=1 Tax=Nonomuraea jabiensis TaxID=882448 RepID=A0A7W9FYU4_9ACTN|nr:N-6 DNA methylase [Nonomuraea jabiensis]MBB5774052.1 type I restriction enzyme M protein [Nonomuraea jabiensis]